MTIKNSKAKMYSEIEKTHKALIRKATIQGVATGYRALSKLVIDKIENGYSLEQVKKFCENVDKEYESKSKGDGDSV